MATMHQYILYIYKSVLALLLLCSSSFASAQICLGYCTDAVNNAGIAINGTGVSCAMALPPAQLADYSFCEVSAVQVGLYSVTGLSQLKVWVRDQLRGEDLAAVTLSAEELQAGWNEIPIPTLVSVADYDTLYVGYDYVQSINKSKIIGASGTKKTKNSFWMGANNIWQDRNTSYAPACVRAVLSTTSHNAISLLDASLSPRSVISEDEPLVVRGEVRNLGSAPLTSFQVTYTDTLYAPVTLDYEVEAVPFGQTTTFEFTFQPQLKEAHPDIPLTLSVDKPNGQKNEYKRGAETTLYYEIGRQSTVSTNPILVEEFTSQLNGYAPYGQHNLREAIEEAHRLNLGEQYEHRDEIDGYQTHYILLSRHQGYGPADDYCVTSGSDYKASWFGPGQLTFAPAVWINRLGTPVSSTLPVDSLARCLSQGSVPQYLNTYVKGVEHDQSKGLLTAEVGCDLYSLTRMEDPRIVCVLVQKYNNLGEQNNYYPSLDAGQQDVVRAYGSPSNASLFSVSNRADVMAGKARIADPGLTYQPESHNYTITYTFTLSLPEDIETLNSLSLVTYVYDMAGEGAVCGAAEYPLGE